MSNYPTQMTNKQNTTSSVRASRDGHEFHEAWAARLALQLLFPTNNLVGIAVEGLSPSDENGAESETVEIADLVLYFGKRSTFDGADKVKIIQYKYSISYEGNNYRVSDAKKTIAKFASAFLDHKKRYGVKKVRDKLMFELVTNQSIFPAFEQAITLIANGTPVQGEIKKQADQFITASSLKGKSLIEFASKFQVSGRAQNLNESKNFLSRTIADWSASDDAIAKARLGEMRQMVRNKAGSVGTNRNVIERVDVLAVLNIGDVDELLPCPSDLPEIGKVVERKQLAEVIDLVSKLDKPLLIHAAGGVGKTVFLNSLANSLVDKNEVLFFDCFGGGRYRAPEDSRHLPNRGLIHIANTLACRGLCDPILPSSQNVDTLIRTFKRRLSQCVRTLSTGSKGRQLVLFIDAIDNAALHAKDLKEPSFPTLLLESFYRGGQINGVKIIVSCRSHRIGDTLNDVPYHDFKLEPFTITETETYLRDRLPNVTHTEIQVAQARSGGNARVLEHLVKSNRGLLDQSEINNTIKLDDLLNNRIQDALSITVARGSKEQEINTFLAGLSILPPPIPIDEFGASLGIDSNAIESFASDLAPLLERTNYGLMFRDEPTETLIREKFGSSKNSLRRVAQNLLGRQDVSVYAARALPALLQKLDAGKQLFDLAFDERFPQSISSTVGKRKIRYARLKAAVLHAANQHKYDRLVRLLVELSTIASVEQRGADYLLNNPDLVVAAQDGDAIRRLFETRTTWSGKRHARLTIANTLSGDFDEAYRHALRLDEWVVHYHKQDQTYKVRYHGYERLDIAAIPFCLLNQNRAKDALNYLRGWKDWYAFEVGEILFGLIRQAETIKPLAKCNIDEFLVHTSNEIGVITATLCFMELDLKKGDYIKNLANACRLTKKIDFNGGYDRETGYLLQEGLLKSSIMALSTGLIPEALSISRLIPHERPSIWSLRDHLLNHNVLQFLEYTALISALKGRELRARDILPKELYTIASNLKTTLSTQDLRERLKERLSKIDRIKPGQSEKGEKKSISYEEEREAKEFLNDRLEPLLSLTNAFSQLLWATGTTRDQKFLSLLNIWAETRKIRDLYNDKKFNFFFQMLGNRFAVFALWVFPDLRVGTVRTFLKRLHEQEILSISTSIEVIAILSKTNHLQILAGEEAIITRSLIESENEVTSRASYYAQLARAILPASSEEASEYFKVGLEQLDAIGSGDYQFTNELLLFAASIKGHELIGPDFHTLTNICELNIPDDSEKFTWYAFAKALSRTSGCKALAKLARWDDRSKVSLEYTLLPYLTALIDDNKIAPEDALALNQLADPAELYECDTSTFAYAIEGKNYPNTAGLMSELIRQYELNNPRLLYTKILSALKSVAERTFGKTSAMTLYLSAVQDKSIKINSELDARMNYQNNLDSRLPVNGPKAKIKKHAGIDKLINNTNPLDARSVKEAILRFYEIENFYTLKEKFFNGLRSKIKYSDRTSYIKLIGLMEDIDYFTKLEELQKCKTAWGKSSSSLASIYHELGISILQNHSDSFISFDYLSENRIQELSVLTDIPISLLSLELIRKFSTVDSSTPASAWLGLAALICEKAKEGEAQAALVRLLNSPSAKLSSKVVDGEWQDRLYPKNDQADIAAGLVWRMLGSPKASERWRAVHSMRCFAGFERCKVINALISKFPTRDAHPFQAPELPFYYLHARLWLLIGLARIALDAPRTVARYKKMLIKVALDTNSQHVLMRHFASQALLTCLEKGSIRLPVEMQKMFRNINRSPFPRLEGQKEEGYRFIHQERPKNVPVSKEQFFLDYDFEKYSVDELGKIFGKPRWEIEDLFTKTVRGFDPTIKSMYENKGREGTRYEKYGGMSSKYHTYGQQLGWHASFLVSGELLSQYPVTDISYHGDPWAYYLDDWMLTRNDGLWLADGMDRIPIDVFVNLLEKGKNDLAITGNKAKIQELIGINSDLIKKITVQGNWHSSDGIDVFISSALVSPRKAKALATELLEEEPQLVWIPHLHEYGDESFARSDKEGYSPWIVCPAVEGRLDDDDPLGFISAVHRPYPAKNIIQTILLKTDDPFMRNWKNSSGEDVAFSDAWGYHENQNKGEISLGTRFMCTSELLKDILKFFNANLLILIKLQRYEKGIGNTESKFSNTVAVVQVRKNLTFNYYKGAVNKIHESKF